MNRSIAITFALFIAAFVLTLLLLKWAGLAVIVLVILSHKVHDNEKKLKSTNPTTQQ